MTDTKHTPKPWKVKEVYKTVITDASGNMILDAAYSDLHLEGDDKPNAAHIVKCVNMHDELVDVLHWIADNSMCEGAVFASNETLKKAGAL